MFYLAPFQSTYNDTINSYYIESGRTTMNYAKKVVIFISCTFFHKEYLIRKEGSTKNIVYMLSLSLYSDTTLKFRV